MMLNNLKKWVRNKREGLHLSWLSYKETLLRGVVISAFNIVGNILPLLMTIGLYAIKQETPPEGVHYKDGQFYLYSASWLASAVLIFFDRKDEIYDRFACLCYLSVVLLFGVSIVYAFHLAGIVIPDNVKYTTSIWVFSGSIVIFIISNLLSRPTPIDPREVAQDGINRIKDVLPNG